MIVGKPFKLEHNCKKGYKWVITRVCDKCGDQKNVQGVTEVIQRQVKDGFILCTSCSNGVQAHLPSGSYKNDRCFKKDDRWLINRVCSSCGDTKEVSCGSVLEREKNGKKVLCWKCSQKNRELPLGKNNGNWKHGLTKGGYKRITIDGKRMLLHRHLIEKKLGRRLTSNENVHHIDLNKLNNDLSNLYVCSSRSKHGSVYCSLEKCGFNLFGTLIWYDKSRKKYTLKPRITNVQDVEIPCYKVYNKTARGTTYAFWWDSQCQVARRFHVIVAEHMLKRKIRRNESVHHIDGDTLNNIASNLDVMKNSKHKVCHYSLQKCAANLYKAGDIAFIDGIYAVNCNRTKK